MVLVVCCDAWVFASPRLRLYFEPVNAIRGPVASALLLRVCVLSIGLGVLIFVGNVVFRRDAAYEAKFPWSHRLSIYLAALMLPPLGIFAGNMGPWWLQLGSMVTVFSVPVVGLFMSLWLGTFRRTRERVKLARGLLFVSLIPVALWMAIVIDPSTNVVYSTAKI